MVNPEKGETMQEKMDTLYVVGNKSYHYDLVELVTGEDNPFKDAFVEAMFVFCPNDPSENHVVKSMSELLTENGYLRDRYAGRTHFIH